MSEAIRMATPNRMNSSPTPVHDTAHVALSAYVPAPMIGTSPIRPNLLPVSPPLDVPAARFPARIR